MRKFLFIILTLFSWLDAHEHNTAICTIFKNCSPFLKEWIEFHRMLGIEHFYLFDNSSEDNPRDVLNEYIRKGVVTLIDWPDTDKEHWGGEKFAWVRTTQLPAYDYCVQLALGKVKWLAMIDSDEFIVPIKHKKISKFLAEHENESAIILNWATYGTSGVWELADNQLMIEALVLRAPLNHPINRHTKTIVRPEKYAGWIWPPHTCALSAGLVGCTISQDEARINHYINRTQKYFLEHKVKGKEHMDNVKWDQDTVMRLMNEFNDEEDLLMDQFIPKLKKRMTH